MIADIARHRRDRKSKTNLLYAPFAYFASIAVKGFAYQFSLLAISAILAILCFASFAVKRFCLSDYGDAPISRCPDFS